MQYDVNAIRKSIVSASCRQAPWAIEFKVHAHEVARPSVDSSEASVQDLFGVSGKDEIIIQTQGRRYQNYAEQRLVHRVTF